MTSFSTETQLSTSGYTTKGFNANSKNFVLGAYESASKVNHYDGYMAEVHFIDGQALTPSSFGTTGSNGRWKPKTYSGTYGTNGFYLDFADSGNLGDDESGNTNDFTATNLAATDQVTDTPHNNFATLNELTTRTYPELREGNLQQYNHDTANSGCAAATIMPKTGKWYCEMYLESPSAGDYPFFGITDTLNLNQQGDHGTKMAAGFEIDGATNNQSSTNLGSITNTNTGWPTFADNDIVMFALDCDNRKWWIGRNGTWTNSGDPAAGSNQQLSWTNDTEVCSVMLGYSGGGGGGDQSVWNFGQEGSFAGKTTAQGNADENGYGDFYYSPPSGYVALCTNNLPEPTIKDSGDYFNTVLYTGNNVDDRSITGVGFQPDFMWSKERTSTGNPFIVDSSRGVTKVLQTNLQNSEATVADGFQAFESDGFQVGAANSTNETGVDYVNWCWKINGGTETTNNDGTIESYVQTNTTAGISIAEYQGNGTLGATFGHGLGSVPDLSIYKCREQTVDWAVWSRAYNPGGTNAARLNTDAAWGGSNGAGFFNDVAPTSSVITLGNRSEINQSSQNYVSYHFKSIPGFSKFGVYIGNGNADGTFVYTGFKPAFVMVKAVSRSGDWIMEDATRSTFNPVDDYLRANSSNAEVVGTSSAIIDFTSNGFKCRANGFVINESSASYIYMAFAEAPFGGILTNEATAR